MTLTNFWHAGLCNVSTRNTERQKEDIPRENPSNGPHKAFSTFVPDAAQGPGGQGMRAYGFSLQIFVRHGSGLLGICY